MQKNIRRWTAAAIGAALALAGCGNSQSAAGGAGDKASSHYVLTIATTAGPLARNFNPFLPTSVAVTDNAASFIYEPLVQFNPFKPQKPLPWLATSWKWADNDKTLTINLRQGVKWSDGTPFTSKDVAFTFNLMKRYPAANGNGLQFNSVAATSPSQVVFHFAKPAYSQFYALSSLVYIVPQKSWAHVNPTTYTDTDPVGTGPYRLTSFDSQGFTLTKNSNYWQKGKPVVYQLRFPSYNGNDAANVAVENGTSQWSGQFIPDIKKVYLSKSPYNHNWSPATSQVALVPNVSKYPLNDLTVRKAISEAINRPFVAHQAESGQATAQTNATGILPNESEFIAPQYKHSTLKYDPKAAKALLESDGWKPGPKGILEKNGKPLDLTITENSGYTDYMTGAQVLAQELSNIGIHATVNGVSNNAWISDLADGDFELSIDYSNSEGIDPEIIYDGWLDDSLIHGTNASADYGRFRSPQAENLIHQYLDATTSAQRNRAIDGMEGILVNQVPVFVLFGGPDWTQYNSKVLVGWPSPSDPYDPGAPFAPNNEVVVLHLHFRGK